MEDLGRIAGPVIWTLLGRRAVPLAVETGVGNRGAKMRGSVIAAEGVPIRAADV